MPPHMQYIIYGQSMHEMTKSAAAHPPSYHQSASQKKTAGGGNRRRSDFFLCARELNSVGVFSSMSNAYKSL